MTRAALVDGRAHRYGPGMAVVKGVLTGIVVLAFLAAIAAAAGVAVVAVAFLGGVVHLIAG